MKRPQSSIRTTRLRLRVKCDTGIRSQRVTTNRRVIVWEINEGRGGTE